jgi:Tol biopolymer transport system component
VVNFDGTDARRFEVGTTYPDGGMRVTWRPDGMLVAAIAETGAGTHVHVVDPATGAAQPFAAPQTGLSGEWYPSYSRGDGRVYFNGTSNGSTFDLYRLEANGTGLAPVPLAGSSRDRFRPDVSPDGTKIAVMTYDGFGSLAIRVYDIATGNLIGSGGPGTAPRWSPDGQWIAYGASYGGALRVMRPDGSDARVVSSASYGEWVDWTADGNWLVASLVMDGGRLALVNVATGQQLPLPVGLGGIAQPAVQR